MLEIIGMTISFAFFCYALREEWSSIIPVSFRERKMYEKI
jgi:hypothetical protein